MGLARPKRAAYVASWMTEKLIVCHASKMATSPHCSVRHAQVSQERPRLSSGPSYSLTEQLVCYRELSVGQDPWVRTYLIRGRVVGVTGAARGEGGGHFPMVGGEFIESSCSSACDDDASAASSTYDAYSRWVGLALECCKERDELDERGVERRRERQRQSGWQHMWQWERERRFCAGTGGPACQCARGRIRQILYSFTFSS